MDAQFWHERWTNDQIGFHQAEGNPALRRHAGVLGPLAGRRVFVPLCGKSVDMLWLAAQGAEVVGVELSGRAVGDFFEGQGLTPARERRGGLECFSAGSYSLWCGDFFDLDPATHLGPVNAVYDRAALVALPQPMRARYAPRLLELAGGAPILLITLDYEQERMSGPPFAVADDEVRALFAPRPEAQLLEARDVISREPRFRERGLPHFYQNVWFFPALD